MFISEPDHLKEAAVDKKKKQKKNNRQTGGKKKRQKSNEKAGLLWTLLEIPVQIVVVV